jgi:hypothetical protein
VILRINSSKSSAREKINFNIMMKNEVHVYNEIVGALASQYKNIFNNILTILHVYFLVEEINLILLRVKVR